MRAFKIGWAPDDWDQLAKHLRVSTDVLEDAGLGFTNRRSKQQDAFRGRVMFPIFDANNVPVALGGRVLGKATEGQPKYKNSPETKLYSKRRTLYGLNWAKDSVVREGEIVVCEGYTDVIGFVTSGVPQAVATCGTALGEDHVRLMKNYANRVVLAYDADAAGQSAAERFYEWERKFEIDLFVAALPKGSDPADVARKDPEALKLAVKNAKPYLEFRLDRALQAADLRAPETRARAAERAIALVAEHPNPLVRDQYVMKVADALRFEIDQLRQMLATQLRKPKATHTTPGTQSRQQQAKPASSQTPARAADNQRARGDSTTNLDEPPPPDDSHFESISGGQTGGRSNDVATPTPIRGRTTTSTAVSASAERAALLYATQHANEVAELLQGLMPNLASALGEDIDGLAVLAKVLFVDDLFLSAFTTLLGAPTLSDALDTASPQVAELLNRLAVEDEALSAETSVSQQVADTFAMLFWTATQRAAKQMRVKSSETGETFDLGEVKAAAEHLLDSTKRVVAMRRLIPWLVAMAEDE